MCKAASLWRLWAKTIGPKISDNDREADAAAIWRTVWVLFNFVVGIVIMANAFRHWND
jgi:hypothetical protein